MFRVIVEKELRELFQSPRFVVTYGIVAVLILLSFWLAAGQHLQNVAEVEAARSEATRQLQGQTDWARVEPRVHRPPSPLESLVAGIGHDVGRSVEIAPGAPVRPSTSLYGERPLLALWRVLDLDFVFRVVLSLFAILFTFDAISGEKERGTLRLALSNAVPRDTFILAKMVGAFFGLVVPLLVPILGGCLLLLARGVVMEASDWLRLASIVGVGCLYLTAFLGLSLLVSARTHRASTSFLVLLVLWIGVVLVVPSSAVLAAGRAVDVPSVDADLFQRSRLASQLFAEDREALSTKLNSSEGTIRFEIDSEDGEDPADAIARIQADINGFLQERADQRRQRMDALDRRLAEQRGHLEARRQDLALGLARLSPAAVFSLAAMDLAGTSLDLPRHFARQAVVYRDDFERFVREQTGRAGGGIRILIQADGDDSSAPPPLDPADLPVFRYTPLGPGHAIEAASFEIGLLAAFAALCFAGAHVSFLRYDPR
ncbi:MAG: ABC transporter permease subunit [Acidobacteriota bacterium]